MPTIVLTNARVTRHSSGCDLRVYHLCRHVDDELHLVVGPLDDLPGTPDIDREAVFASVHELDNALRCSGSWRRHLRIDESSFLQLGYPETQAEAVHRIRSIAAATGAARLIVFGSSLAGLAYAVGIERVLFDIRDIVSLRLLRGTAVDNGARARSLPAMLSQRLRLWRCQRTEGRIPCRFAEVATISEADTAEVCRLAGGHVYNVADTARQRRPLRAIRRLRRRPVDRSRPYSVMINPMRNRLRHEEQGARSFRVGLAVVSTTSGMEAFP